MQSSPDGLLAEFNVSGPYPEEEINGDWKATTFTSGGVIVHEAASQARVNVGFYCTGTGAASDLYSNLVSWIETTWDQATYGALPDGEPACSGLVADGWCESDGSGFSALPSNTIRCNWEWTGAPAPQSLDTLPSAEILDRVPAPWQTCPASVLIFPSVTVVDGDPELPDAVCKRLVEVLNQAVRGLREGDSGDLDYTPLSFDEVWSCLLLPDGSDSIVQCFIPGTTMDITVEAAT